MLKWDKVHEEKGYHTKFQKLWLGPFVIAEKIGPRTFSFANPRRSVRNISGKWTDLEKIFLLTFSYPKFVYNFVYELVFYL